MSLKAAGGGIQDYLILATENLPLKGNRVTVFKLYLFFFFVDSCMAILCRENELIILYQVCL